MDSWLSTTPRHGALIRQLTGHSFGVSHLAFSPDGRRLASCAGPMPPLKGGELKLWEVESGRPLPAPAGHAEYVHAVSFSPDGTRLASCSMDHTVKVWDLATTREVQSFSLGEKDPVDVAFSPEGTRLASVTGNRPGQLLEWDLATSHPLRGPPPTPTRLSVWLIARTAGWPWGAAIGC